MSAGSCASARQPRRILPRLQSIGPAAKTPSTSRVSGNRSIIKPRQTCPSIGTKRFSRGILSDPFGPTYRGCRFGGAGPSQTVRAAERDGADARPGSASHAGCRLLDSLMETADASDQLKIVLSSLTAIAGRILQTSDPKASVVLGTGTNAVAGSAAAAAVTGIVGSLGTASTGAAIAGLSGAAKTTATLYWIGGFVGGGVAAGTLILGAGALGVGLYGSIKARRAIFGATRAEQTLSERELRILEAIRSLTVAIQASLDDGREIAGQELALFLRIGVAPLLGEIEAGLGAGAFDDLKTYHRVRLRGDINNLRARVPSLERS